jgi:hypothetical protein
MDEPSLDCLLDPAECTLDPSRAGPKELAARLFVVRARTPWASSGSADRSPDTSLRPARANLAAPASG